MELETKPIVVREIPVDLWKKFKVRSVEDGKTIQEAMVEALKIYLKSA